MILINIYDDGIEFYNKNGRPHRLNGPAVITDNHQYWYKNGQYHREDGPAFNHVNSVYFYIEGFAYMETEYHHKLKEMGIVT